MTGQSFPRKYLYFSERRIRSWLDGSGVVVPQPSSREVSTPSFGNTVPTIKWSKNKSGSPQVNLSELFEKKFSDRIVRDLGSPRPMQFAAGVDVVNFGEFVDDVTPRRALMHVDAKIKGSASRAAICMFGSLEHYADSLPRSTDPSPRFEHGWTSLRGAGY